ncbi:MAG: acyl--CoA ligase [Rhodocyclaceae bacterium]|nr:acyl--CoA ligase [Rhodocyclaceae bacterium]
MVTPDRDLLIDHFESRAREAPDWAFLRFVGETPGEDVELTYGAADLQASDYARALLTAGAQRGDRVGLLMRNSPDWLLWYFACQKIGVGLCALNPDLLEQELSDLIQRGALAILIAAPELYPMARLLKDAVPTVRILGVELGDEVESVAALAGVDAGQALSRDSDIRPTDTLSVVFTSGTTSARSKGVIEPIGSIVRGVRAYQTQLRFTQQDLLMLVTPLFHAAALNWGVTLAVLAGATIVLAPRFSASRFWAQAARGGCTVLWTMGAVVQILLLQAPSAAERAALARLRLVFGVGAGARHHQARERWQVELVDGYGSSETPGTLTDSSCFEQPDPFPCVGRPVAGVELRIVDPESGAECAPRQRGEIVARFGQGFGGYLGDAQATREAVRDGWFHTGDLAYVDDDGRFYFVDRLKDIIRRGGENLSAREIEQAIARHPAVAEATVVPKPHPVLGEVVAAFVVPRDSSVAPSLPELRSFCAAHLPAFKWPEALQVVAMDDLPRTPTGRVRKFMLKQRLRAEAGLPT